MGVVETGLLEDIDEVEAGSLTLILIFVEGFACCSCFWRSACWQCLQMKWKSSRSASASSMPRHLLCCQTLHLSQATLCSPSSTCPWSPQMQSKVHSVSSSSSSCKACLFFSISARKRLSDKRPASVLLLPSDNCASSSSCCMRRVSRSRKRFSREIKRLSRSFSIFNLFCSSFLAAASSASLFWRSSRSCSSCLCCSALPASRLDLFAFAIFSRLSSSLSRCSIFRFRDSSCFSSNGSMCSSIWFRSTFSFGSLDFFNDSMKLRTSPRVMATHSQVAPSKGSWSSSGFVASSISSAPLA